MSNILNLTPAENRFLVVLCQLLEPKWLILKFNKQIILSLVFIQIKETNSFDR